MKILIRVYTCIATAITIAALVLNYTIDASDMLVAAVLITRLANQALVTVLQMWVIVAVGKVHGNCPKEPYSVSDKEKAFATSWYMTLLVFMEIISLFIWLVELAVAIYLATGYEHTNLPVFILFWVKLCIRIITSPLPLRWTYFFGDDKNKWYTFNRGRCACWFRWIWFLLGQPKYLLGKNSYAPVLKEVCEQDQITGMATTFAYLMWYRSAGLSHHRALGMIGALYFANDKVKKPKPQPAALSEHDRALLQNALYLSKYAIATYTRCLLDCARSKACCCMWCTMRRCGRDRSTGNFAQYVEREVAYGKVKNTSLEVSYFINELEHAIVVSIRGTENPRDVVTDGLMLPVSLEASDLGLDEEQTAQYTPNFGKAHLGVLLSTRALCKEISPLLSRILQESSERRTIWVVGHSLGGSVAQLTAYHLNHGIIRERGIIRGIGYQPMPIFDYQALSITNCHYPNVMSVPFGDDIVPRLSIRCLNKVVRRVAEAPKMNTVVALYFAIRFISSLLYRCATKAGDTIKNTEKIQFRAKLPRAKRLVAERDVATLNPVEQNNICQRANAEDMHALASRPSDDQHNHPAIYLAGTIYHIERAEGEDEYMILKPTTLEEAVLSKNLLLDHVPWRMTYGLAKALGFKYVTTVHDSEQQDELTEDGLRGTNQEEV